MSDLQTNLINEELPEKKMGFIQRVVGVITSPGKVMENLAAKPRILFPLFLVAFSQLALILIRMPLYQDSLRKAFQASSKVTESLTGVKVTPEMIEKNLSQGMTTNLITTPLGSLFGWFLITVVFFAIIKIAGGQGKFKQYLSVIGYAYVISALYLLITLCVSYFTGSLHLDIPLTSIGNAFGDGMKGSFLFGMIKGLDVFKIWYYAVIAIGLQVVSGFKKSTIYGIVAIVFTITLLIAGAGEAAMGAYM